MKSDVLKGGIISSLKRIADHIFKSVIYIN